MPDEPWAIEVEPEVDEWLSTLNPTAFARAGATIELLEQFGVLLGEPHTRQLQGKLRELRLFVDGRPVRITYAALSGRRFVLLTVFFKDQRRMAREIGRARRALERRLGQEGSLREDDESYVA